MQSGHRGNHIFVRPNSLISVTLFCLFGISGCSDDAAQGRASQSDDDIAAGMGDLRSAVYAFYNAWYDADWDLYISFYADDIVFIDSEGDHMSLDEQDARAADISEIVGSVVFDQARENLVHTVRVSPTGEAGVAYWTFPFDYRTEDGVTTTIEYAESDVWWKIDGKWKVVLIHYHEISRSDLPSE